MVDARSKRKRGFLVFLVLLAVASAGLFSVLDASFPSRLFQFHHELRMCVVLAFLVSSEIIGSWKVNSDRSRPTEIVSWSFIFAIVLLEENVALLLSIGIARIVFELIRKKTIETALFSGLSIVISFSMGAIVLHIFGITQGLDNASDFAHVYLLGLVVAAEVVALVSGGLRALYWSNIRGSSLLLGLRREATETIGTDSVLLLLGVLVVAVVLEGWPLVPVASAVALAVQIGAQRALDSNRSRSLDILTNLPNRATFERQIDIYIQEALRRKTKFAVLLVDLDGFSEINDKLGLGVGDATLRAVGGRLEKTKRPSDLVARLGGDEFGFLAFDIKSVIDIDTIAKRLRTRLAVPLEVSGCPVAVSGTIGVSVYPDHATTAHELLRRSDVALFRAKQSKLGVVVYEGDRERFQAGRFSLLADLREAIGTDQLYLVYQPKIDLATNVVSGFEALLRWNHPKHGLIAPGEFMPLAEQTELMGPLTNWVLETALNQCAQWHRGGIRVAVAINGSAKNFHDFAFPASVDRALRKSQLDACWLEIEITESTVMADPTRSKMILQQLRNLGVSVSVDDFGSGYSSFSYLKKLPISTVKIDSSFVTSMNDDESGRAIVRAIIDLARNLRLKTVAEGVETEDVMDSLRTLGCTMAQGYYILKPAIAEDVTRWMYLDEANRRAVSDFF